MKTAEIRTLRQIAKVLEVADPAQALTLRLLADAGEITRHKEPKGSRTKARREKKAARSAVLEGARVARVRAVGETVYSETDRIMARMRAQGFIPPTTPGPWKWMYVPYKAPAPAAHRPALGPVGHTRGFLSPALCLDPESEDQYAARRGFRYSASLQSGGKPIDVAAEREARAMRRMRWDDGPIQPKKGRRLLGCRLDRGNRVIGVVRERPFTTPQPKVVLTKEQKAAVKRLSAMMGL